MKLLQALIFTFIFGAVAFAQTTGSLRGQVVDQNGAVVPNATVVATNGNGIEKTVVSNAKGEYTVIGLPAGTYTVRANAETFADYENTEVTVTAGRREELIITLTVAIAAETVTVGGEQINAEPENNASATVLKGEDLEALPEDPDELAAALQALAGSSAGPNGGQLYIDGFTGGRLPPREAIREIRINQNPFSSEFERPGFGRIEILTKPGADRLRGQVFFNFNDESLNSRNPFAPNRASSQTRFFGGNLSGPIIKNKASFFIDIDNRQIDDNAVINATILDSNLNPTLFAQSLIVPTRRFSISPRFDYAINDRNTLVARYSFQRNTADNRGIGEFSLPSLAFNTENTEHNIQLTETAIIAPNIVNETRFQYNRQRNQQDGDNSIPTVSVSGSFVGGGSSIGLNYTNEDRYELSNYTTWTLGKHNLRFGARLRGINLENRSESNFAGTFTFTGRPFVADNPATTTVNEELPALSSLQQYRLEVSGANNVRSNPNQFTITAGDPLASISQTDFGVFINDDWRVNPGLTLSFGLRYEAQTNVKNNLNFAPRFGFAYSPGAGGAKPPKTVFRGGFGIFYDRIGENLSLNEVRFDGQRQLSYTVTNSVLLAQPIFTLNGVTNVPTIEQIAAIAPGSSIIRRLSDDIRSPFTMNGAFSVERQLPFRTTLSATYLMTRSYNLLRQRNINAPVCSPVTACPVGTAALNALRPDPTTGNIYEYESTGEFNQQQLLIGFNTRFNPKISLFGNYRLSRAKSDVDGGGGFGFGFGGAGLGGFPLYSYDLSDEYGNSTQDIRHFAFIGGSVEVPFGIRLNPFITIRSGSPFNIITGFDRNGDGQFTERPTFAELGSRCQALGLASSFCDIGDADPNSIIPRNYGRGPGSFNVNLNMTKTFGFGGSRRGAAATAGGQTGQGGNNAGIPGVGGGGRRGGGGGGGRGGRGGGGFGQGGGNSDNPYNLTFGLQISNLLNNVNTGNPINNLSSPRFGQFNSLGGFGGFGGGGGSNAGNRRVTLQVRFSF